MDFLNGRKKGDEIKLKEKSIFEFSTDESEHLINSVNPLKSIHQLIFRENEVESIISLDANHKSNPHYIDKNNSNTLRMQNQKPKYKEGQLVEFKDYQDQKYYTGRISSVIHSDTDPITEYSYILNGVNFGQRPDPRWESGLKDGVNVIERNIIRSLEDMSVHFLLKNGWYISENVNHPKDLYVKNTYPIAIQHEKDQNKFWVYNLKIQNRNIDIMKPLENEKEYDDLIIPILKELKNTEK